MPSISLAYQDRVVSSVVHELGCPQTLASVPAAGVQLQMPKDEDELLAVSLDVWDETKQIMSVAPSGRTWNALPLDREYLLAGAID